MRARKLLALALVAGLIGGSLGVADAKKKKKKKKKPKLVAATSTFYLRHESPEQECSDKELFTLSLTDGEDYDCQYAANAAWPAMGYVADSYVTADGVPFKLDATKNVTGVISMRSYFVGVGAGPASVTVQLTGTAGGAEVTLGEWSTDYTVMPATTHTFEYEIEVDDALNKKDLSSLTATVIPDGTTVGLTGVIEHDEPPATVIVPTLKKK